MPAPPHDHERLLSATSAKWSRTAAQPLRSTRRRPRLENRGPATTTGPQEAGNRELGRREDHRAPASRLHRAPMGETVRAPRNKASAPSTSAAGGLSAPVAERRPRRGGARSEKSQRMTPKAVPNRLMRPPVTAVPPARPRPPLEAGGADRHLHIAIGRDIARREPTQAAADDPTDLTLRTPNAREPRLIRIADGEKMRRMA